MTNEEKAKEIELNVYAFEKPKGEFEAPAYRAALEMAQYKDQQFKFLLESEIERMKVDYPDTATIQIRRYLEGLVKKLFNNE